MVRKDLSHAAVVYLWCMWCIVFAARFSAAQLWRRQLNVEKRVFHAMNAPPVGTSVCTHVPHRFHAVLLRLQKSNIAAACALLLVQPLPSTGTHECETTSTVCSRCALKPSLDSAGSRSVRVRRLELQGQR